MPLGGGTLGSAHHHHHHGMYEDPDAHLGHHRPLVMHRHHHHQQLAHHHHYQQHHSEVSIFRSIMKYISFLAFPPSLISWQSNWQTLRQSLSKHCAVIVSRSGYCSVFDPVTCNSIVRRNHISFSPRISLSAYYSFMSMVLYAPIVRLNLHLNLTWHNVQTADTFIRYVRVCRILLFVPYPPLSLISAPLCA